MSKKGKRYSPKFQVVLEVLKGDREAVIHSFSPQVQVAHESNSEVA